MSRFVPIVSRDIGASCKRCGNVLLAWDATCPCQCAGHSPGGACRMSNLTKALLGLARALLTLVAFALCVVILWKINYPTYAWNQKLAVTVSTPRGEVSGSSVVAVSYTENFFSGGWGGALYHLTLRGDATTVDLGGGQLLFALLAYEHSQEPHSTGMIPLKLLRLP